MGTFARRVAAAVCGAVLFVTALNAQGRIAEQDWTTSRVDAQRTSAIRFDAYISRDSMTRPDFKLQWTLKLNRRDTAAPLGSLAITTGLIHRKPLTFVGTSNAVYAVDNDTGVLYWETRLPSSAAVPFCAARPTTSLSRAASVNTGKSVHVREGWGPPRRAPFIGGVGEPGEGVPEWLMRGGIFGQGARRPNSPALAHSQSPVRAHVIRLVQQVRARPVILVTLVIPSGLVVPPMLLMTAVLLAPVVPLTFALPPQALPAPENVAQALPVYALTNDGVLRFLGAHSGKEVQRPMPFLPPNAHVTNLAVLDNVAYAMTSSECGGVPGGLWRRPLGGETSALASWKTNGSDPVGAPAFSATGTVYIAVGNSNVSGGTYANAVLALDPRTMTVNDWFTHPSAEFTSTPVIFRYKGKDIVTAGTRDGRLFLLDGASLGGVSHLTALYVSPQISSRPLSDIATWEDASGTRWIVVPVAGPTAAGISSGAKVRHGEVVALKLTDDNSTMSLQTAWLSKDLTSAVPPVVVNGVVFTIGGSPAVLYALDGLTGNELWSSGKTLWSPAAPGGLWTSAGQVHVATVDGTLFTFGFPMERY